MYKIIASLLSENPSDRISCSEILKNDLFKKFNHTKREKIEYRVQDLDKCIKKLPDIKYCRKLCNAFYVINPLVEKAAKIYYSKIFQDNTEIDSHQLWLYCVIMAIKMYEIDKIDIETCNEDFEECEEFDEEKYIEIEKKIIRSMNFCTMIPY